MNGLTFLRIEKHNLKRKQSNYILDVIKHSLNCVTCNI